MSPQGALNSNETFLDNAKHSGRLDEHMLLLDNNEYFALSGSFNIFLMDEATVDVLVFVQF